MLKGSPQLRQSEEESRIRKLINDDAIVEVLEEAPGGSEPGTET